MEQLLRVEGSRLSPTHSPAYSASSSSPNSSHSTKSRNHDAEEGQNQKKSVLTKVKEKAKKLRHSLSKKKHDDGNNTSLSWGGFEDDGVEENAEYFGAPMYESAKVHEGYIENANQENARHQHQRKGPLISDKQVLSINTKDELEQDREKLIGRNMSRKIGQSAATATKTAAATTLPGANKNLAEKLTPSNAEGSSKAAHSIASKIQDLSVSQTSGHHTLSPSSSTRAANPNNTSLSNIAAPKPLLRMHSTVSSSAQRTPAAPTTPAAVPSSAPAGSKNNSPTSQLWDKAVSVKDYLLNKFEPGEDEKALSQVISEAVSPKKSPSDVGMIEKVKEAVTSFLGTDEPKKHADTTKTSPNSSQTPLETNNNARASSQGSVSSNNSAHAASQYPISTYLRANRASSQNPASSRNTTRASSQLPVSTNAQEVAQEENHGRILQAN